MGNDPLWNMMFGVAAGGAFVMLAILIFKLVMSVGEKIQDRIEQRRKKSREDIWKVTSHGILTPNEAREIQWAKDGKTGFVVTEKPLPETKPKKFHRHMWRFHEKIRDLEYCFKCECGDMSAVPIWMFWGSPTIRSERALRWEERTYVNKKKFEKAIREGFRS